MMSLRHAILDTAPVGAVTLPNSAGQQLFQNPWETASAGPQATNKQNKSEYEVTENAARKVHRQSDVPREALGHQRQQERW
jgi:hypothetical protein